MFIDDKENIIDYLLNPNSSYEDEIFFKNKFELFEFNKIKFEEYKLENIDKLSIDELENTGIELSDEVQKIHNNIMYLFKIGEAENTLDNLAKHTNPICFNYSPTSDTNLHIGNCSTYKYRGLVCRLFGYGATKDKFAKLRIATCSIIKEQQTENYKAANEAINNGLNVPIFTDYYMNLSQIDFRLGNIYVHINKALQMALEEVLQYYAYRIYPE
jgi:hypothetical protein